jgi:hypothetical protein
MVVSLVDQVFSFVETLRMLPQEDSGMPQAGGADHSEQQEVSARSRFRGLSWDKKYQRYGDTHSGPRWPYGHVLRNIILNDGCLFCRCSWRVRIYFGGKQRHVGEYCCSCYCHSRIACVPSLVQHITPVLYIASMLCACGHMHAFIRTQDGAHTRHAAAAFPETRLFSSCYDSFGTWPWLNCGCASLDQFLPLQMFG